MAHNMCICKFPFNFASNLIDFSNLASKTSQILTNCALIIVSGCRIVQRMPKSIEKRYSVSSNSVSL